MLHVVIQEEGEILGEMRIEAIGNGSRSSSRNYRVEYAAESGGGIVDLKRRVLYDFPDKYNSLALVNAALNLLEYEEMEMTDENHPGHMARGQRGTRQALPGEAFDPERNYRSAFWRR